MCFTAEISLTSWLINVFACGLLYALGTRRHNRQLQIAAILFALVGLQQLYDYVCWISPGTPANRIATKLAMLSIHLQPIVLLALVGTTDRVSVFVVALYAIVATVYTVRVWNAVEYTAVTPRSTPSLDWAWTRGEYSRVMYDTYLIALLVLIYRNFESTLAIGTIVYLLGAYAFSFYKYQVYASTGRFWCFFGSFYPALLWLVYAVR